MDGNSQSPQQVPVLVGDVYELAEVEDGEVAEMIVLGLTAAKRDHLGALIERIRCVEPLRDEVFLTNDRWTVPQHAVEVQGPNIVQVSSLIALASDNDHKALQKGGRMIRSLARPDNVFKLTRRTQLSWMRRLLELNLADQEHRVVIIGVESEFLRRQFQLYDIIELSLLTLATSKDEDPTRKQKLEIRVQNDDLRVEPPIEHGSVVRSLQ